MKDYEFTSILLKSSYFKACTNCNKYKSRSSSGACLSLVIAYLRKGKIYPIHYKRIFYFILYIILININRRTTGCVNDGLSNSNASSTSIGAHCNSKVNACFTSVDVPQFIHFKNFVKAFFCVLK